MTLVLERSDVERFRDFVCDRLGLRFDDEKLEDLAECLRRRLEGSGLRTFGSYLGRLTATATSAQEMRAIVEQLTVGETYFFRNPNHFRAVMEIALPRRLAALAGRQPLRVLSAGCASGEEAYTLALLAREHLRPDEVSAVQILGIDVNPLLLEKARSGCYSSWSLRATPVDTQQRWFRSDGQHSILEDELRQAVAFEERNLLGADPEFWRPGAFDVIFCRNVLIYFSQDAIRATVARFAHALVPGGFLFLGDAENLRGLSHEFHLRHSHDTFYYQVLEEGEAALPPTWESSLVVAPQAALPIDENGSWVSIIHDAADRISRLVAPHVDARAPQRRPLAPVWDLSEALQLLRQERYAEAIAVLGALPAEAETDMDVQLLKAILLTNTGDVVEAETACCRILARDEFNAGAHYLLALCHEHAGDHDAALRHDRFAAYLDPAFAMPRLHLGRLAKRRGDLAAAREELTRALDLLAREDASRIVLLGGGFNREALMQVCRAELSACGGPR